MAWRAAIGVYRIFRLFRCLTLLSVARLVSWRVAYRFGWAERSLKQLNLRGTHRALSMRIGSSSDFAVFTQIFLDEGYKPLRAIAKPRVIVDCGANVGYVGRYLLDAFPNSRLIAIEPDPENFKICQLNLEPFRDRSSARLAAVWTSATRLNLLRGAYGDGREDSTQVRPSGQGETADVVAVDIPTLMEQEKIDGIDILKIDIEGSELELFRSESTRDWLPKVRNIAIELHSEDCEKAFFDALAGFRYTVLRSGELHICMNIEPL
jgi:FkbM family methyltransferase